MLPVKPLLENSNEGLCGPASLKMVFDYYGVEVLIQEIAEVASTTKEMGTNAEGLKKAAEQFGFTVEIKNNSTFEDIQAWLDKKVPVIVDWFTRGSDGCSDSDIADGHYSVVVGIDDEYIYLQDPEIDGVRKISRDNFMKVWFDFTGEHISPNELIIRQTIAVYR